MQKLTCYLYYIDKMRESEVYYIYFLIFFIMNKTKLLLGVVIALFMFALSPSSAMAGENWGNHDAKYKAVCTDLNPFIAELGDDDGKLDWDAYGLLEAAWDVEGAAQWELDHAKTKAAKKAAKKALKIAEQGVWDAEGNIKWLKNQIKKLQKNCVDIPGYGHGKKNDNKEHWNAWWNNWKNWF